MSYLVVIDSCGELTPDMKASGHFMSAPLTMDVDQYHFVDDETFDQQEFLKRVRESPNCPRSACPSPQYYKECFDRDFDHLYAVTLSGALSGSYNSAQVGRTMALEEHPDKKIHVVDSWSACCGEASIALRIRELKESGLSFEEVVDRIEAYKREMRTYFVLDNLDTLRKNGRLTGLKSLVASTLNVKPVMSANEGVIIQRGQAVGTRKALIRLVDIIAKETERVEEKRLMITHVNCYERAMTVRDMILSRCRFRDAIVVDAAGVATVYAGDGGIVVTA